MIFDPDKRGVTADGGKTEIVIEAEFEWAGFEVAVPVGYFIPQAEVPFTEAGGGVIFSFEEGGEGSFGWVDDETDVGKDGVPSIGAKRIFAGETGK